MDVRQLEYFVAVAEELNFTRAAARCSVVQSALSYQIARLEREERVTLFHRSSRSVHLAAAGELLLPRARAILRELAETSADLDLAFVGLFADQLPAGLAHAVLVSEPLVAVLAPDHPLAARPIPIGLAELGAAGAFIEMREESGLRVQVDAAFERAGAVRRVAFELASSGDVVRLAGLGFGIAVVPRSAAATGAGVAVLDLDDPAARHPITLVHRTPAPSSPSARAYLALLTST